MSVVVTVKALKDDGKALVRRLCVSSSLVKYDVAGWVDSKKLIKLLHEYFMREVGTFTLFSDIFVKCSFQGSETKEIHFDSWGEGEEFYEHEAALQLIEPKAMDLTVVPEKKKVSLGVTVHDPDAKGFCKHCLRRVTKYNEKAHCEQRRREMLDALMSEDKKRRVEKESEEMAYADFKK